MQPITHIRMPMFTGEYFLRVCVYNVHGRVSELRLSRCPVLLSVDGEAGWRDGCAAVTWTMCIRPRVYITYMCMNVCVYRCVCIKLLNFTKICIFSFWYYYLILNINHISDENIIYMCLPSIYMILPVFYCFYYMFLLFVCIHAL